MNNFESKMLECLYELKEVHGVYGIKAEFEAEGARMEELMRLSELVVRSGLKFIIKIGGCEAVHDMNQCKVLGSTGIMAPMIETPFAMSKYISAAKRVYGEDVDTIEWIINAETKTCFANYDAILAEGKNFLSAVTVGRSDLSASMGIARTAIETQPVYEATRILVEKSKERGLTTNFGGNIGVESIPFIQKMSDVADRFETRKVVIRMDDDENHLKATIQKALYFEYLYLLNKANYYNSLSHEDDVRIERMKRQIDII